jgi:hypothetical protein
VLQPALRAAAESGRIHLETEEHIATSQFSHSQFSVRAGGYSGEFSMAEVHHSIQSFSCGLPQPLDLSFASVEGWARRMHMPLNYSGPSSPSTTNDSGFGECKVFTDSDAPNSAAAKNEEIEGGQWCKIKSLKSAAAKWDEIERYHWWDVKPLNSAAVIRGEIERRQLCEIKPLNCADTSGQSCQSIAFNSEGAEFEMGLSCVVISLNSVIFECSKFVCDMSQFSKSRFFGGDYVSRGWAPLR